jgi:hypothetical protein
VLGLVTGVLLIFVGASVVPLLRDDRDFRAWNEDEPGEGSGDPGEAFFERDRAM